MTKGIFDLILFIGAVLLIIGLRYLSSPKTAIKGNRLAALGLGVGVIAAIFYPLDKDYGHGLFIVICLFIGSAVGVWAARKVAMTAMPEMVSLFNGFGGLCAMLIAVVTLNMNISNNTTSTADLVIILVNLFLGGVAFNGSMVAFGKLSGKLNGRYMNIPFPTVLNIILLAVSVGLTVWFINDQLVTQDEWLVIALLALVYGFIFVAPIGGADMPVVISLLNSLTGVTAAISGVITDDKLMLLGGILVGSSGRF